MIADSETIFYFLFVAGPPLVEFGHSFNTVNPFIVTKNNFGTSQQTRLLKNCDPPLLFIWTLVKIPICMMTKLAMSFLHIEVNSMYK